MKFIQKQKKYSKSFGYANVQEFIRETINGSLMIDSFIRTNMLFNTNKNQISKLVCKVSKQKYSKIIQKIFDNIK